MDKFMVLAAKEAGIGMKAGHGGPFGAVLVRKGKIVAKAHNEVISTNDPTAHAEINAIRRASKKLHRFDLSDCVLYTSCEPCPMCLAAIHWARIPIVYYGCTRKDAARIGFDDSHFYDIMEKPDAKLRPLGRKICLDPFRAWEKKADKVRY